MNCSQCGADLSEGTLFCPNCGTAVQTTAPAEQPNPPASIPAAAPDGNVQQNTPPTNAPQAPNSAETSVNQNAPVPPTGSVNAPVPPTPPSGAPSNPVPPAPPSGTSSNPVPPNGGVVPPNAPYNGPIPDDSGLTTGMKVLWAFVGFFIGLIGLLIAWLVNKGKGQAAKHDGLVFCAIGMAVNIAFWIVLSIGGGCAAISILENEADYDSNAIVDSADRIEDDLSAKSDTAHKSGTNSIHSSKFSDEYGNLTLAAIDELNAKDIVDLLEENGLDYDKDYEGWITEDAKSTFDVYDWFFETWLDQKQFLSSDYTSDSTDYFFRISSDCQYSSAAEFLDAFVSSCATVNQTDELSDSLNIYYVTTNNGDSYFISIGESPSYIGDGYEYELIVMSEDTIDAGALDSFESVEGEDIDSSKIEQSI